MLENHKKVIATLCYVVENDKVLMLHRNKKENDMHEGKYNGLGGKCEKGEDPYTCVVREVKEEAGIDITPTYIANMTFDNFMKGLDWEVHLFRADGYSGTLKDCNEGDLEWVAKEELFKLNLWDGDRIFLKYVFDDTFFFARFRYDDG
ncbi:MAG: NUDIX hydrolase, partial [Nanoarchaeota archaeon]